MPESAKAKLTSVTRESDGVVFEVEGRVSFIDPQSGIYTDGIVVSIQGPKKVEVGYWRSSWSDPKYNRVVHIDTLLKIGKNVGKGGPKKKPAASTGATSASAATTKSTTPETSATTTTPSSSESAAVPATATSASTDAKSTASTSTKTAAPARPAPTSSDASSSGPAAAAPPVVKPTSAESVEGLRTSPRKAAAVTRPLESSANTDSLATTATTKLPAPQQQQQQNQLDASTAAASAASLLSGAGVAAAALKPKPQRRPKEPIISRASSRAVGAPVCKVCGKRGAASAVVVMGVKNKDIKDWMCNYCELEENTGTGRKGKTKLGKELGIFSKEVNKEMIITLQKTSNGKGGKGATYIIKDNPSSATLPSSSSSVSSKRSALLSPATIMREEEVSRVSGHESEMQVGMEEEDEVLQGSRPGSATGSILSGLNGSLQSSLVGSKRVLPTLPLTQQQLQPQHPSSLDPADLSGISSMSELATALSKRARRGESPLDFTQQNSAVFGAGAGGPSRAVPTMTSSSTEAAAFLISAAQANSRSGSASQQQSTPLFNMASFLSHPLPGGESHPLNAMIPPDLPPEAREERLRDAKEDMWSAASVLVRLRADVQQRLQDMEQQEAAQQQQQQQQQQQHARPPSTAPTAIAPPPATPQVPSPHHPPYHHQLQQKQHAPPPPSAPGPAPPHGHYNPHAPSPMLHPSSHPPGGPGGYAPPSPSTHPSHPYPPALPHLQQQQQYPPHQPVHASPPLSPYPAHPHHHHAQHHAPIHHHSAGAGYGMHAHASYHQHTHPQPPPPAGPYPPTHTHTQYPYHTNPAPPPPHVPPPQHQMNHY